MKILFLIGQMLLPSYPMQDATHIFARFWQGTGWDRHEVALITVPLTEFTCDQPRAFFEALPFPEGQKRISYHNGEVDCWANITLNVETLGGEVESGFYNETNTGWIQTQPIRIQVLEP